MSAIPNLSNISSISRLGSVRRPNNKAYLFDGVNDYIAGDTTIGRTGYDMNVAGNVSTGSDSDGSYFWINGNRLAGAGTNAFCGSSATPVFTQASSFTIKVRAKVISLPPSGNSGFFGSYLDCAIYTDSAGNDIVFGINGSTSVTYTASGAFSLGTMFDAYLVYDSSNSKFYAYVGSTLQNAGGTSGPATFTTDSRRLGEGGLIPSTDTSCNKYIYHAAIRNVALTQAEIDADIALGNTTKTDPRIVAYYIPENLQYNTDYITTKDFTDAARTKTGTTPTGGQADLRGGTNACLLDIAAGAGNGVTITNNTVTGSRLASKTFIMKVFAWTTSGTATMRLRISHNGVATYYSSNQTVTTVPQEFTFTQALTSSSSGTGMTYGIEVGSGAGAATFIAYYPTDWLTNQTLRDESPNIGGYIGRKTQKVISCWFKPQSDTTNSPSAGGLLSVPWLYINDRGTAHTINLRYDDRLSARTSIYQVGDAGFRDRVHTVGVYSWTGSVRQTKLYVNGSLVDTDNHRIDVPVSVSSTTLRLARLGTTYFNTYIRDARIYTFTGSFTDADALAIYNGLEPSSAGITKYLHWRPTPGETGTTAIDHSGNSRTGTLTGGTTRAFLSGS